MNIVQTIEEQRSVVENLNGTYYLDQHTSTSRLSYIRVAPHTDSCDALTISLHGEDTHHGPCGLRWRVTAVTPTPRNQHTRARARARATCICNITYLLRLLYILGLPSRPNTALPRGVKNAKFACFRRLWSRLAPPRYTLLKAHLANIRSTSGLPKLDPFSLYVEGIGKRRGK